MTQPDLFGVVPSTVDLSKSTPLSAEFKRREGNYHRVLERLRQGPATNVELAELAGYRFGARLEELKRHGIKWDKQHVVSGTWRYFLTD